MNEQDKQLWGQIFPDVHMFGRNFLRKYASAADEQYDIPSEIEKHPMYHILSRIYVPIEFGGGWPVKMNQEQRIRPSAVVSTRITEELAFGDPGLTCALPGPSLCFPVLEKFGSDWQKQKYFSIFSDAEPRWGAFAITEPESGSDAYSLKTRAVRSENGYLLRGNKCFVTNGSRADFIITFATVDSKMGQFGIRAFIIDPKQPGVHITNSRNTFGLRAAGLSEIFFDNCIVPQEQVIYVENQKQFITALAASKSTWNFFRLEISAMAVGTVRAVEEELSNTFKVDTSLLKTKISIARAIYQKAASGIDEGKPSQYDISIAKAYCAELAMSSCLDAIKQVGIRSLEKGQILERLFRDAKSFNILEGTGEIQRENIVKHFGVTL